MSQEIDLPHNWTPRDYQKPAWDSWLAGCNRQLLIWHRRAGKDDIDLRKHSVAAFNRVGTYWHMLPEFAQARKAIWDAVNPRTGLRRIDEAFPLGIRATTRETDMFIRFKNGSTWQAVGSDNFNSLVGTPPVGLTVSEWALADPTAWAYLAPILAENKGWASFITTPRGNNHVKRMLDRFKTDPKWFCQILSARDTGAISEEDIENQRAEYAALFGDDMADMLVEQEFYCSFSGALLGAIFGREMNAAEREGRIRLVEIDRRYPVHTAWDLGKPANNPIWCFQVIPIFRNDAAGHPVFVRNEPRVVDFFRPDGDDLEEWVSWLNERGYNGTDYVPHDILTPEWGSRRTRLETLKLLKRKPVRIPKVSVLEGQSAARRTIKVAVFHSGDDERGARMQLGVDGLKSYRREWDEEAKRFRDNPVKDWAEHIGSAFRYLGLAWKDTKPEASAPEKPKELQFTVGPLGIIQGNMDVKSAVEAMMRRRQRES